MHTDELEIAVTADTTRDGRLVDLQTDDHIGTTGNVALDHQVSRHIANLIAARTVLRQLDEIAQSNR